MSESGYKRSNPDDEEYSSDECTVNIPTYGYGLSINGHNDQTSAASSIPISRESAQTKLTEEQKEKEKLKALAESLFSLEADPQIGNVAKDIAVNIFRHMTSGEDPKSNEELRQLKATAISLLSSQIPELKELNDLAKNILESASTPEAQKLAGSIFAYINCSVYGLKLTPEQEKLMRLAKKLVNPSSTLEQLEIAEHVFTYLVGTEGIGAVANASLIYINGHHLQKRRVLFSRRNEVDTVIMAINSLSTSMFEKELKEFSDKEAKSASASETSSPGIRDFEGLDDEDVLSTFGSLALGSSTPERTVEFFNTPGNENFLFVRMLRDPYFEARMLLGKVEVNPRRPIRHWMSATAIKYRVRFRTYHDIPIGFLYNPYTSVADVTVNRGRGDEQFKKAWGTKNLNNSTGSYFFNLKYSDEVLLVAMPDATIPTFEEKPIGEKLEEMQKGETKETLPNNEVFIHPTIENMLGIVITSTDYLEEARGVRNHIKDNGGPPFPIFLYTPGELTLVEA